MTHQETERTAELLVGLAGRHSVIVVEHDMGFVRSIARKVTVLHEGRVLMEGGMDEVQGDARVVEVYLGACDAGDQGPQPVSRREPRPVGSRPRGARGWLLGGDGS